MILPISMKGTDQLQQHRSSSHIDTDRSILITSVLTSVSDLHQAIRAAPIFTNGVSIITSISRSVHQETISANIFAHVVDELGFLFTLALSQRSQVKSFVYVAESAIRASI